LVNWFAQSKNKITGLFSDAHLQKQ